MTLHAVYFRSTVCRNGFRGESVGGSIDLGRGARAIVSGHGGLGRLAARSPTGSALHTDRLVWVGWASSAQFVGAIHRSESERVRAARGGGRCHACRTVGSGAWRWRRTRGFGSGVGRRGQRGRGQARAREVAGRSAALPSSRCTCARLRREPNWPSNRRGVRRLIGTAWRRRSANSPVSSRGDGPLARTNCTAALHIEQTPSKRRTVGDSVMPSERRAARFAPRVRSTRPSHAPRS